MACKIPWRKIVQWSLELKMFFIFLLSFLSMFSCMSHITVTFILSVLIYTYPRLFSCSILFSIPQKLHDTKYWQTYIENNWELNPKDWITTMLALSLKRSNEKKDFIYCYILILSNIKQLININELFARYSVFSKWYSFLKKKKKPKPDDAYHLDFAADLQSPGILILG